MTKINEHKLALEIVEREGKRISLPIGQVKEVVRITLTALSNYRMSEVLALIEKHNHRLTRGR